MSLLKLQLVVICITQLLYIVIVIEVCYVHTCIYNYIAKCVFVKYNYYKTVVDLFKSLDIDKSEWLQDIEHGDSSSASFLRK